MSRSHTSVWTNYNFLAFDSPPDFKKLTFFYLPNILHSLLIHMSKSIVPKTWITSSINSRQCILANESHVQSSKFNSLSNNHGSFTELPRTTSKSYVISFIIKLRYWDQILHQPKYMSFFLDFLYRSIWDIQTNITHTNNIQKFPIS